jgi:sugar phosphate isomerase/epimerase
MQLAAQLYTLRHALDEDFDGTLAALAEAGVREVEVAGLHGRSPAAFRAALDAAELIACSGHVALDDFERAAETAEALGMPIVVVPWVQPPETAEEADTTVERIVAASKLAADAGLGFAYHNHDFEFTVKDGDQSLFDILIAERDPALVGVELDLFWAVKAGEDPKALIRRLPGQIYAYHVKDMTADGGMISVGKGTIDFADIFTLNDLAGVRHLYVENDQSPAPYLPDITTSFATLARLGARTDNQGL